MPGESRERERERERIRHVVVGGVAFSPEVGVAGGPDRTGPGCGACGCSAFPPAAEGELPLAAAATSASRCTVSSRGRRGVGFRAGNSECGLVPSARLSTWRRVTEESGFKVRGEPASARGGGLVGPLKTGPGQVTGRVEGAAFR